MSEGTEAREPTWLPNLDAGPLLVDHVNRRVRLARFHLDHYGFGSRDEVHDAAA